MELNEDLNDYNNFPERDGIVLPEDLYAAWENPKLADIDMLIGTNQDEVRYWIKEMGYYTDLIPGITIYRHGFPILAENNMKTMSEKDLKCTEAFLDMQSGRKVWRLTELYNELLFRVPAMEQAVRHADGGGKSYTYYWTMPGADKDMGACHAIELSYIFNNPQETIYTGGLYDTELADAVQDMWVSFARDGNPGTKEYIWEPYSEESRQTMILGNEIQLEDDLKSEQRLLVEPLLRHYFNGCYSQISLFVPQTWRIIAQLIVGAGLIFIIIVLFLRILGNAKKNTVG